MNQTQKSSRRANGEGTVYFDNSAGRWVAAVTAPDGKRHKRTSTSRGDAKAALKQLLQEVEDKGTVVSPKSRFAELLTNWEATVLDAKECAASTRLTTVWALGYAHRHLGRLSLNDLNEDRIEAALRAMAAAGLSRESLIKVRSVIRQVCEFGERRKHLRRNPAVALALPKHRAGRAKRRAEGRTMKADQVRLLLAATRGDRLHALWTLLVTLGLRPGEAYGLHWSDVDMSAGTLTVRTALHQGEHGYEISDQLKTIGSSRCLSMPEPLMEAFKEHRRRQAVEHDRALDRWDSRYPDLVFTTALGTPLNPSNVRREFAKVTTHLGWGSWSPNELRHTCVSLLYAANVRLERIADVVGHVDTRMTARVYRHAVDASVKDAMVPMNSLFATADGGMVEP